MAWAWRGAAWWELELGGGGFRTHGGRAALQGPGKWKGGEVLTGGELRSKLRSRVQVAARLGGPGPGVLSASRFVWLPTRLSSSSARCSVVSFSSWISLQIQITYSRCTYSHRDTCSVSQSQVPQPGKQKQALQKATLHTRARSPPQKFLRLLDQPEDQAPTLIQT